MDEREVQAVPVESNDYPTDYEYDDDGYEDHTCPVCDGTGGDPWNDGITPCDYCDGEGCLWWM